MLVGVEDAVDVADHARLAVKRAEEVRLLRDSLRTAGSIGWESAAAEAFRDELEICARDYSAGADALEDAADALRRLAFALEDSGGE